MKVFVAVLLFIGSVAARGSGPYLPSGWKPDGPAFYLPSEVAKPIARIAQEPLVEETEASGSDALREYGPPKLELAINVNQGLPDVATEQTFFRAIKEEIVDAVQNANVEANTEQVAAIVEEVSAVTEAEVAGVAKTVEEEVTVLSDVESTAGYPILEVIEQKQESLDIIQSKELKEQDENVIPTIVIPEDVVVPTAAVEVVVPLSQQELVQDAVPTPVSDVVASVRLAKEELVQDVVSTPSQEVTVEKVAEGVNNIAEAILNLDKEVKAIEVQAEVNDDITSTQVTSGSLEQAPEGFLEYGPPGFLEYGPPNQQVIEGLVAEAASSGALENNEVRRRRFSPKFRSPKKH